MGFGRHVRSLKRCCGPPGPLWVTLVLMFTAAFSAGWNRIAITSALRRWVGIEGFKAMKHQMLGCFSVASPGWFGKYVYVDVYIYILYIYIQIDIWIQFEIMMGIMMHQAAYETP